MGYFLIEKVILCLSLKCKLVLFFHDFFPTTPTFFAPPLFGRVFWWGDVTQIVFSFSPGDSTTISAFIMSFSVDISDFVTGTSNVTSSYFSGSYINWALGTSSVCKGPCWLGMSPCRPSVIPEAPPLPGRGRDDQFEGCPGLPLDQHIHQCGARKM